MKQQHHVIYVPGILDDVYKLQGSLVHLWRIHGVHGHCHEIPWAGPEKWRPKLDELIAEIDRYAGSGHKVSLVGASAGASAVLNAYVERSDRITGLVYMCAKINGLSTVSPKTYAKNPAFKDSLSELQVNLKKLRAADKAKMLSLYSEADKTVPYAATVVQGVQERRLPPLNHGKAILYGLSLGAGDMLSFLKGLD